MEKVIKVNELITIKASYTLSLTGFVIDIYILDKDNFIIKGKSIIVKDKEVKPSVVLNKEVKIIMDKFIEQNIPNIQDEEVCKARVEYAMAKCS